MSEVDAKIAQAEQAIAQGDLVLARELLIQATEQDEFSKKAWHLLADVVDNDTDRRTCIENCLTIDPNDEEAWDKLRSFGLLYVIAHQILARFDPRYVRWDADAPYMTLKDHLHIVLTEESILLSRTERQKLGDTIREIIGTRQTFYENPLDDLLGNDSISTIIVTGCKWIAIQKNKQLRRIESHIINEDALQWHIRQFLAEGKPIPTASAHIQRVRIKNDALVSIIAPPLANGDTIIIIQHALDQTILMPDVHTSQPVMDGNIRQFFKACMSAYINMLVIGEAGAGKTSIANLIASFIPDNERIITVEPVAEYQLSQEHVISLEGRDLIENVTKMRPDRVIFGDITQMNIPQFLDVGYYGWDGTIATMRARDVESALAQLEMVVMTTYPDFPLQQARNYIAKSLTVVVVVKRFDDGVHKITQVTEILKSDESPDFEIHPIFDLRPNPLEPSESLCWATGYTPSFVDLFVLGGITWRNIFIGVSDD